MALVTLTDLETEVRPVDTWDDTIVPSEAAFETNPSNAQQNFETVFSAIHHLRDVQGSNWWAPLVAPVTLETGAARGVQDVNNALHLVEKKRVLRERIKLVTITVGGSDDFVVLDGSAAELPANTTAAVGLVTTLGTVVAFHAGTFGTHSLDEVAGSSAISPQNLVGIVDSITQDPIDSGGNRIFGLLQSEIATDGHTFNLTTQRVQISFVRINGAGNDLEAVPAVDIQGQSILYFPIERTRFEDLTAQDFLSRRAVELPTGTTVSRQTGYDNQGTTPVDLTTNATLDLEGPGLIWSIRDDLEAPLFELIEGSAGGTSQFNIRSNVDEFDVDAVLVDFANGASIGSALANPININKTAGHVATTSGNLHLQAAAEVYLDDVNRAGSAWTDTNGILLSATIAEWTDYIAAFGDGASLLDAIVQADVPDTVHLVARASVINGPHVAGTNLSSAGGTPQLDTPLLDHSTFDLTADVHTYLNGKLLWPSNTPGTFDVNPGTDPTIGDIKINEKVKTGYRIQMVALPAS